ncbi:cobalt-zinc-cadmium efflux system membrane fusion protein [Pontibacter ummariensis]|uniref:Membrane fusion protein, cobalt-zinc-cadmium efflux system n=2 Tax=Pontibacter ummariensis TaxID=1610492 RepID=A0A239DQA9_9BACT|nr:cobalt-zinc-cadmium efflux system membrane fusion protein [Pontibacter ummariensis]SNS33923.1 membrane fusion protein, cobalt-zinc-cadmium efflux system [Pontibacter ummariensis]
MQIIPKVTFLTGVLALGLGACSTPDEPAQEQEIAAAETGDHVEEGTVRLSPAQLEAIGLKLGPLQSRNLSATTKVTGELEVPPQSEANVSATVGGNIQEIKVIEGDKVKKGQTLALLTHPDLVQMQVDLQEAASRLQYLEQEYQRQQRLYEQKVGSGRDLQEATANYNTSKSQVEGLKSRLRILGLNPNSILAGRIFQSVPVISPISGAVQKVTVNTGQYVSPQEQMFIIVDQSQLHADLMVFENDIAKVKVGQKVYFTVANSADREYTATVYNVSPAFEKDVKAVHLHADIEGGTENLIPGTYIEGRIAVDSTTALALPEEAVVQEGNQAFIFVKTSEVDAEAHAEGAATTAGAPGSTSGAARTWVFKQVPVQTGASDSGWVEVKLLEPIPEGSQIAYNGAYNLISEMNKGDTEHGH